MRTKSNGCSSRHRAVRRATGSLLRLGLIATATVGMRVFAASMGWLSADFAEPLRGAELLDILTGWALPLYAGAVATERGRSTALPGGITCALFAGCLLLASRSLIASQFWLPALISMPVSMGTGAVLALIWQAFNEATGSPLGSGGAAGAGNELQVNAGVPGEEIRRSVLLLASIAALLLLVERGLAGTRSNLTDLQRAELASHHAAVFLTSACESSRTIEADLRRFQQEHPNLRLLVVDQGERKQWLLRDRLAARYGQADPYGRYPVPVMFTAEGYYVGRDEMLRALERLVNAGAPSLVARVRREK